MYKVADRAARDRTILRVLGGHVKGSPPTGTEEPPETVSKKRDDSHMDR